MSPRTGSGPGRRSAGAAGAATVGTAFAALAAARAFGVGVAALVAAFGLGAAALVAAFAFGAAGLFFGSGFLLAIDVTYGSRAGEGSQGQPDESGHLARWPVNE